LLNLLGSLLDLNHVRLRFARLIAYGFEGAAQIFQIVLAGVDRLLSHHLIGLRGVTVGA
jgi:hypothetical protein